jgi:hypothetical protein
MTTHQERTEELLDELYEVLSSLRHYYEGMMHDLALEKYTGEQAERDLHALIHDEGKDVLVVLAELAAHLSSESEPAIQVDKSVSA